eukprot:s22_g4.t1
MQSRRKLISSTCKLCAFLLFGDLVGYFISSELRLPQWLMLARSATGAVIMALLGLFLRHRHEMRKPLGLIREWQKMGAFESTLCGFLQSLPLAVQSPSLAEALERTQATRLQLDDFLQQLQMKGLIFDPSTTSYEAGRSRGRLKRSYSSSSAHVLARSMAQNCDVLARRQQPLQAIEEILAACAGAEMSEAQLEEMLSEVKEHFTDLSEFNQQRKDNVSFIVNEEKENLEKFRKLHDDVEWECKTSGALSACTAAAGLAVGLSLMCPVTLAGVALFSAISGAATSQHRTKALQVQESLAKDMEAKNVPI